MNLDYNILRKWIQSEIALQIKEFSDSQNDYDEDSRLEQKIADSLFDSLVSGNLYYCEYKKDLSIKGTIYTYNTSCGSYLQIRGDYCSVCGKSIKVVDNG